MNDNSTLTDNSVNSTAAAKKYKILVVEDEEDAKVIFKTLIATNPEYDVYAAGDGTEALELLKKTKDFDLVLLDIIMPTMDGIETLKNIKTEPGNYGTPIVVMLTNIGGEKAVEHSKEFNADGYILKIDVEPEQLMEKIAEILRKGGDQDSIQIQEVRDNILHHQAPETSKEPDPEAVSQQ